MDELVINTNNTKPTSEWTDTEWETFRRWLVGMLQVGPVTVTFTKKDGTERVMLCTLEPSKLPPVEIKEGKKERKKSEDNISVFDLEANAWKSFVIKSVKNVFIKI